MTAIGTVAEVLARMRAIDRALSPQDGAAVFNRVYLRVTELVAARLATGGVFADDEAMAELDVRFAGQWFDAYDADAGAVPRAWRPLFAVRADRSVWPIQFALAGMNAHIEHDLPLAVVATCEARGTSPTTPGVRGDFDRVNDLLAEVEADIRRSFLTEVGQAADRHLLGPVTHLVSSWKIEKARDVAWVSVLALWELRDSGFLSGRYTDALAHTVGLGSRLLLTPTR